jgi:hypothetical protein
MILSVVTKTACVFVKNSSGNVIAGVVDGEAAKAVGCRSMAICIEEGISGPKGFGLRHVEDNESRAKQIKGLGYKTVADFMHDICANYDTISAGGPGRIAISKSIPGYALKVILQVGEIKGRQFFSAVTAIPARKIRAEEILWQKVIATE